MACTDAQGCILVSYHPETKSGKFFGIQRNETLINVVMDVCESIHKNEPLHCWYYGDIQTDKLGGELPKSKILDFEILKPLRTFIKSLVKNIPVVKFLDETDFQLVL